MFYFYNELKSAIDTYTDFWNYERLQKRFNDMKLAEVHLTILNTSKETAQYSIKDNKTAKYVIIW